jgi:hypothetical protein
MYLPPPSYLIATPGSSDTSAIKTGPSFSFKVLMNVSFMESVTIRLKSGTED